MKKSGWKYVAPCALGILLALIPHPEALSASAWYFLSIFIAMVVGLILEPVAPALVGLISVVVSAIFVLVPDKLGGEANPGSVIRWALSGFGDGTVWLIFTAFMFALGYEKSGLGRRLSLLLIKFFGKSTLGLGYAVAISDLVLAPFMSSNTARSGGTIFPMIKNIPKLYEKVSIDAPRTVARYIAWVALVTTCVTSSLFMTALAPNILALSILDKLVKLKITWVEWFIAMAPAGILLFIITPLLSYFIYSPRVRRADIVVDWAKEELRKIGAMSRNEWLMLSMVVLALLGWVFAGAYLNSTTVALIVLVLMVLTGVLTWDDVIKNSGAWNVLIWFSTLIAMSLGLGNTGVLDWIAGSIGHSLTGYTVGAAVVMLILFNYLVHYFFASTTAHTTAMLPVMLTVAATIPGIPMKALALLLVGSTGFMGILTPYGTGPSPIYYGSHLIRPQDFWWLGAVFGGIYLIAHLVISYPWIMGQFGG